MRTPNTHESIDPSGWFPDTSASADAPQAQATAPGSRHADDLRSVARLAALIISSGRMVQWLYAALFRCLLELLADFVCKTMSFFLYDAAASSQSAVHSLPLVQKSQR